MSTQSSNKPKILITGANGLLGQKLVEQLVQQGKFDVIATGRGPCRLSGSGYTYQVLDIENQQEVDQIVLNLCPEVIIHGAAMTHVDECEKHQEACYRANVLATKYMIAAAEKFNRTSFLCLQTLFFQG